jgi:hypothetical protein
VVEDARSRQGTAGKVWLGGDGQRHGVARLVTPWFTMPTAANEIALMLNFAHVMQIDDMTVSIDLTWKDVDIRFGFPSD